MLFKFTGPIFNILVLRANASESERLTQWNGSFTVERVATVHAEILVLSVGFTYKSVLIRPFSK